MRISVLSTYDIEGGAARAAYTLHQGLRQAQVESTMLVKKKFSDDKSVIGLHSSVYPDKYPVSLTQATKSFLDTLPLKRYKRKKAELFSVARFSETIFPHLEKIDPDIININWCCLGFLNPETFASFRKPIIYTLHDMWGFTGGCHYTGACLNYQQKCGTCPALGSDQPHDLSRQLWNRKAKAWQNLNLHIVCISQWLADCAQQSSLFQNFDIRVIPNAVDTHQFRPHPKAVVRSLLNLPLHKKIILFGATRALADKRKGAKYLLEATTHISQSSSSAETELLIFGASEPSRSLNFGLKANYVGNIHDNLTLALIYAAADVMVISSIEEAFGLTAAEALACGTPVVCFDVGGLKDIVDHQENGYRAVCFDANDLARGIHWVLENPERWSKLSSQASSKANSCFSQAVQAKSYINLCQEILESNC